MKAIFQKQVCTVEETFSDYVILRTDPWATTMVHLSHEDLVIDPTDDQIERTARGEELPRCRHCGMLDCCCAMVGVLMDSIGITARTKGQVN